MEHCQIADAIGVGAYTLLLDEVYASMERTDAPACALAIIVLTQESL